MFYPHLQALVVFVALNCRPLCRTTAASNIKTTKLVFFVTFSSFYSRHSNPWCNHHFVSGSVTDVSRAGVFWTTSSVSLWCWWSSRVIFMQTVQDLAPDPDPALIIREALDNQNHTSWHHGKLQFAPRVIAASSMYTNSHSRTWFMFDKSVMCMECVP